MQRYETVCEKTTLIVILITPVNKKQQRRKREKIKQKPENNKTSLNIFRYLTMRKFSVQSMQALELQTLVPPLNDPCGVTLKANIISHN